MIGIPISSLGHLAHALFPLPVLAILLWFAGRRTSPSVEWNTRIDLGLAAISALVVAGLCTLWMPRYYLLTAPLTASDFSQYCESMGALRVGDLDAWVKQRSLVAGALPAFFSRHLGLVDGLFIGSVLSLGAMGAGIFLWARAAHSRVAGLMAAMLVCAIAPLALLSRTVTFYPEAVASYACCGAAVVMALRYRSLPAITAGALGIGWVLLIDVRGLIWALPAFGLVCVSALAAAGWLRRVAGLAILWVVLVGSHEVGQRTSWDETPSLEQQAVFYVDEALRRATPDDPSAGLAHKGGQFPVRFVWGRTPISDIPETLSFLWSLNQQLPDDIGDLNETRYSRRVHVMPFVWPTLFALGLVLWGLRRRPLLLLGFTGGLLPFVIALRSASTAVVHARYIATGIAIVPVILGVGFAVLYLGAISKTDERRVQTTFSRADGIALLVGLMMVLGIVPTWLSPASTWRAPLSADAEPANAIWYAAQAAAPSDVSARCASALQEDYANGFPVGSRLLGWTVEAAPSHRPR